MVNQRTARDWRRQTLWVAGDSSGADAAGVRNAINKGSSGRVRFLPSNIRSVHQAQLLNAAVFCSATLLVKSTFYGLLGANTAQIALGVCALNIFLGFVFSFWEGVGRIQLLFVGMLLLFSFQVYLFSFQFDYAANYNILYSFLPALSFVLFSNKNFNFDSFLRFMFALSVSYSVVYVILYSSLDVMPIYPDEDPAVKILASDGVRDTRVYLSGMFPAFAIYYIISVFNRTSLLKILLLVAPISAIVLANSRAFTAITIAMVLLHYAGLSHSKWRVWMGVVFLTIAVVVVFAVVFDFNVFVIVSADASGSARYHSFEALKAVLQNGFLLGAGLPSARAIEISFFNSLAVFWTDTGLIGIWHSFGFAGYLLFCYQVFRLIAVVRPEGKKISSTHFNALMLLSLASGISSTMSPGVWTGEGGIVLGLVLGLSYTHMKRRVPQRRRVSWREKLSNEQALQTPGHTE